MVMLVYSYSKERLTDIERNLIMTREYMIQTIRYQSSLVRTPVQKMGLLMMMHSAECKGGTHFQWLKAVQNVAKAKGIETVAMNDPDFWFAIYDNFTYNHLRGIFWKLNQ